MVACGFTQILAAWFYRPGLTQILAAWFYRPGLTQILAAWFYRPGLTQIMAAWFYRPGLTQILAAWFYRSSPRIDGCLWLDPDTGGLILQVFITHWCLPVELDPDTAGLILQVLITHWWLPVAWHRYWRPDSTGLDHALVVACGLTQILAAWFHRSWSRIDGCLGLTQILAAWFYRSWSRIDGCLWLDTDTGGLILQAWLDTDTGGLILQVLITHWWLPGLTQILAAWFYRSWSRIGGCLGLTQILAAWFYRSWSRIGGCLWLDPDTGGLILQVLITHWWLPGLDPDTGGLILQVLITHWWLPVAWPRYWRPDSTGLDHALMVACGLTQILAAWFYRSWSRIDGCLWLDTDTGGLILQAWLDTDTGGLILQAWLDPDNGGLILQAWLDTDTGGLILQAWLDTDTGGLILQAWLDPDNGGLILQAWLDPDNGGLILQVFTTHWWLPVAWPRYWRPDSTGLAWPRCWQPDYTGLHHALMVACGLTQILAAWFYRSWSRIYGCLWSDPDTGGLILQAWLDPDTGGLIIQVFTTHWWLPVAWPRYWRPDYTGLHHALMVACGLTQILAAWLYRSWSRIDGCLWLDTDTGSLILQVLITHWWLSMAWPRYWRPDSTGLDHTLVVAWAWPRY